MSGEAVTEPVVKMEDLPPVEYMRLRNEGKTELPAPAAEDVQTPKTEEPVVEVPAAELQPEPDSDPEPEHEEGEEAKSKGKGGFQRRIDKLTKQLRLTEQERDTLREKSVKPAAEESQPPTPKSDKPKIEDFQSPDEWADARDAWKANEERKAEFQERQREVLDGFKKQINEVREQNDDFDEVMNQNIVIPMSVQDAIPTLENGAAVAYHIAKNPDIAKELMDMLPARAIAEVGRISERLLSASSTARPAPVKKIVSKAEAPIQPVGGTAKSTVPLEELPPHEYQRIRNAEERKRRAG
jgi:hypothetical protein